MEDPLRRPQRNCGPNFKGFGWLQKVSIDALGDRLGLGLELEKMKKRGYFDHQTDVRISALLLGLNGVKIDLDQKFS